VLIAGHCTSGGASGGRSRIVGAPQLEYPRLSRTIVISITIGSWFACRYGRRLRSVSP
jgi:hypothetical protein